MYNILPYTIWICLTPNKTETPRVTERIPSLCLATLQPSTWDSQHQQHPRTHTVQQKGQKWEGPDPPGVPKRSWKWEVDVKKESLQFPTIISPKSGLLRTNITTDGRRNQNSLPSLRSAHLWVSMTKYEQVQNVSNVRWDKQRVSTFVNLCLDSLPSCDGEGCGPTGAIW